jgi:antitoxin (DNA-binding transcriptional repressor) of toxin-antitoxin stability system
MYTCVLSDAVEQIGIRELRADLAASVRRAEGGERVVVTVGGRAVAQLGPLDPAGDAPTVDDLVARGLLVRARRDDRPEPAAGIPLWAGARLDRVLGDIR